MTKKGEATGQKKRTSQRVPQQGPVIPKNSQQQSPTLDLNPRKFTHPPIPQPETLMQRGKKNKAA